MQADVALDKETLAVLTVTEAQKCLIQDLLLNTVTNKKPMEVIWSQVKTLTEIQFGMLMCSVLCVIWNVVYVWSTWSTHCCTY